MLRATSENNKVNQGAEPFWYSRRHGQTVATASAVLDIVGTIIPFRSVVDVGCGIGTWLSVAKQRGATSVLGYDGPHVPLAHLQINTSEFRAVDLTKPPETASTFDLAISLEVAEHLSPQFAALFLDFLASQSDNIIFSAAIPGQGGNGHVNEQWQAFWERQFNERGYKCYDLLRPAIWNRDDVPSWYCQNMFLFSKSPEVAKRIADLHFPCLPATMRNLVHPRTFSPVVERSINPGVRRSLKLLRIALQRWWAKPH
jgi:SAM-dependent methyltransferase